jgi:hypothetical protein
MNENNVIKLSDQRNSICSICRTEYQGWGNNADPYPGRCCDSCNAECVVPARFAMMIIAKGKLQ